MITCAWTTPRTLETAARTSRKQPDRYPERVTDQPAPPADPVSAEDSTYAAIVSEFRGLRRAGAGWVEAALLTAAHLVIIGAANEE